MMQILMNKVIVKWRLNITDVLFRLFSKHFIWYNIQNFVMKYYWWCTDLGYRNHLLNFMWIKITVYGEANEIMKNSIIFSDFLNLWTFKIFNWFWEKLLAYFISEMYLTSLISIFLSVGDVKFLGKPSDTRQLIFMCWEIVFVVNISRVCILILFFAQHCLLPNPQKQ